MPDGSHYKWHFEYLHISVAGTGLKNWNTNHATNKAFAEYEKGVDEAYGDDCDDHLLYDVSSAFLRCDVSNGFEKSIIHG